MRRIKRLRQQLSKLMQRRSYLEKRCEQVGKMLPACLILRRRIRGGSFEAAGGVEKGVFAYLTYLEGGITRHRYVRKVDLEKVLRLTRNYREFCRKMAEIRGLNRGILRLLEEIGEIQSEEVSRYVKKRARAKRVGRKKQAK